MNKIKVKDMPGYEGIYKIDSDGNITRTARYVTIPYGGRRFYSGGVVKQTKNNDWYMCVRLRKNNNRKNITVHKLVALAFLGKCPSGLTIKHIDGNKNNNCISNIQYA